MSNVCNLIESLKSEIPSDELRKLAEMITAMAISNYIKKEEYGKALAIMKKAKEKGLLPSELEKTYDVAVKWLKLMDSYSKLVEKINEINRYLSGGYFTPAPGYEKYKELMSALLSILAPTLRSELENRVKEFENSYNEIKPHLSQEYKEHMEQLLSYAKDLVNFLDMLHKVEQTIREEFDKAFEKPPESSDLKSLADYFARVAGNLWYNIGYEMPTKIKSIAKQYSFTNKAFEDYKNKLINEPIPPKIASTAQKLIDVYSYLASMLRAYDELLTFLENEPLPEDAKQGQRFASLWMTILAHLKILKSKQYQDVLKEDSPLKTLIDSIEASLKDLKKKLWIADPTWTHWIDLAEGSIGYSIEVETPSLERQFGASLRAIVNSCRTFLRQEAEKARKGDALAAFLAALGWIATAVTSGIAGLTLILRPHELYEALQGAIQWLSDGVQLLRKDFNKWLKAAQETLARIATPEGSAMFVGNILAAIVGAKLLGWLMPRLPTWVREIIVDITQGDPLGACIGIIMSPVTKSLIREVVAGVNREIISGSNIYKYIENVVPEQVAKELKLFGKYLEKIRNIIIKTLNKSKTVGEFINYAKKALSELGMEAIANLRKTFRNVMEEGIESVKYASMIDAMLQNLTKAGREFASRVKKIKTPGVAPVLRLAKEYASVVEAVTTAVGKLRQRIERIVAGAREIFEELKNRLPEDVRKRLEKELGEIEKKKFEIKYMEHLEKIKDTLKRLDKDLYRLSSELKDLGEYLSRHGFKNKIAEYAERGNIEAALREVMNIVSRMAREIRPEVLEKMREFVEFLKKFVDEPYIGGFISNIASYIEKEMIIKKKAPELGLELVLSTLRGIRKIIEEMPENIRSTMMKEFSRFEEELARAPSPSKALEMLRSVIRQLGVYRAKIDAELFKKLVADFTQTVYDLIQALKSCGVNVEDVEKSLDELNKIAEIRVVFKKLGYPKDVIDTLMSIAEEVRVRSPELASRIARFAEDLKKMFVEGRIDKSLLRELDEIISMIRKTPLRERLVGALKKLSDAFSSLSLKLGEMIGVVPREVAESVAEAEKALRRIAFELKQLVEEVTSAGKLGLLLFEVEKKTGKIVPASKRLLKKIEEMARQPESITIEYDGLKFNVKRIVKIDKARGLFKAILRFEFDDSWFEIGFMNKLVKEGVLKPRTGVVSTKWFGYDPELPKKHPEMVRVFKSIAENVDEILKKIPDWGEIQNIVVATTTGYARLGSLLAKSFAAGLFSLTRALESLKMPVSREDVVQSIFNKISSNIKLAPAEEALVLAEPKPAIEALSDVLEQAEKMELKLREKLRQIGLYPQLWTKLRAGDKLIDVVVGDILNWQKLSRVIKGIAILKLGEKQIGKGILLDLNGKLVIWLPPFQIELEKPRETQIEQTATQELKFVEMQIQKPKPIAITIQKPGEIPPPPPPPPPPPAPTPVVIPSGLPSVAIPTLTFDVYSYGARGVQRERLNIVV